MLLTIVSFVLVMGIVVFVHELGHLLAAKRNKIVVEEFGFGFPPRLVTLFERGGTIYSINAIPFGGFARMRGEDDPNEPGSLAAASRGARIVTLAAGAGMNFILAIVLFAALALMQGVPDASRPGVLVMNLAEGSPASQAGLQVGDRIVAADGRPILTQIALQEYTTAHAGNPIAYEVIRADAAGSEQRLAFTIVPRANPPADQGALGIQIGQVIRPAKIWEAAWAGVSGVGNIIYLTFAIPANLIREGKPIADAGFMGPVGIAATTGGVVRAALNIESIQPVIWFIAVLSTALGLTNLLPLPALDGGRLLFVLVEIIRGRRVEPAREGMVHLIGFGLLLLLVGVLTIREVTALLNGTFPNFGAP